MLRYLCPTCTQLLLLFNHFTYKLLAHSKKYSIDGELLEYDGSNKKLSKHSMDIDNDSSYVFKRSKLSSTRSIIIDIVLKT